ncbi:MAG TPA: ATP-binding protein [Thermoanaerobaculia bacterium]
MTNASTGTGPVVLWLSSRFENIELALAALAIVCHERGVSEEVEHWIGMAVREAVANAIKHGNKLDPSKKVYVSLDEDGDRLTIVVGDEGEGFEPEKVADPLTPENTLKTSGRGIFYIRSFMDDLSFTRGESGGTILTMSKNLKQEKP